MKHIFPLSESIISKIAAGEVIERPVYAIKELLDNAIDAQATEIKIILEDSGLQQITVIDNGAGMGSNDLQEAWKLHTTSKLYDEADLAAIQTLGFRGEALASIASVSKLVIKSKTREEKIGGKIEVAYGKLIGFSPIGLPQGTEVCVYNLFANVPGRKKFLRSKQTELRQSISLISAYAIAYRSIRFTLVHNGRILFDVPQTVDQLNRIALLFGSSLKQMLHPFSFHNEYISLSGYFSSPQTTVVLSQKQHIFINNRVVNDKIVLSAIRDAYAQMHARTFQPVVFLFLTLPYQLVDVNVHPRKEEIRFHNPQMLYDTVLKSITQTLQKRDASSPLTHFTDQSPGLVLGDAPAGLTDTFAAEVLRSDILHNFDNTTVQQVHRLYIVKETRQGLEIVDQHAAHERILYEWLLADFMAKRRKAEQFRFTRPHVLELSLADSQLLQEHLETFAQLGFQIETFRSNSFLVQAVPLLFKDRNIPRLLSELFNDLQQERKIKDVDMISKRMIAYLACRAAVKAGDTLVQEQMQNMLKQLQSTPNNQTCPHGRPTKITIEIGKIHRLFKRKR